MRSRHGWLCMTMKIICCCKFCFCLRDPRQLMTQQQRLQQASGPEPVSTVADCHMTGLSPPVAGGSPPALPVLTPKQHHQACLVHLPGKPTSSITILANRPLLCSFCSALCSVVPLTNCSGVTYSSLQLHARGSRVGDISPDCLRKCTDDHLQLRAKHLSW